MRREEILPIAKESAPFPICAGALVLVLAAAYASHGAPVESDLARTWEEGRVYLPHVRSHVKPGDVKTRASLPAVVLLHGCAGTTGGVERWADILAGAGYAVALPDSFARSYRRRNCDPRTYSTGLFPEAVRMRQEEIQHALQMVRAAAWADPSNLFLMGHSEGGGAVARWRGRGYKALVISGSSCPGGVGVGPDVPILAVNFADDPWSKGSQADCAARLAGRRDAYAVRLPGLGHDTSISPDARSAVLNFLRAQTGPRAR